MARIYRHIPRAPDQHIGNVDPASGHVYSEQFGPDRYLGRVDYARGHVYHHRFGPDEYLGRVDGRGGVFRHRRGPDEYVGRVAADGRLYRHRRLAPDVYLGHVDDMKHPVEGAAAILFFFLEADEREAAE